MLLLWSVGYISIDTNPDNIINDSFFEEKPSFVYSVNSGLKSTYKVSYKLSSSDSEENCEILN